MIRKKVGVFCHGGLGDGIVSMVLSNNFHLNHWETHTYHNTLRSLQSWFPHLPICAYPEKSDPSKWIDEFDLLLVFHNDTHPFVLDLIEEGKSRSSEKVKVIYPYPSKRIFQNPYYRDAQFNPSISIVDNLYFFCKKVMNLEKTTKNNGIIAPRQFELQKHKNRVVFHVSSSREGKNWPIEKFVSLGKKLQKEGFGVSILAGIEEHQKPFFFLQKEGFSVPSFRSLSELASHIYESGYLIGNDSGLGHMASSMGLDTVTIGRRKSVALFWKPGWGSNTYITPYTWIPNFSGWRFRDQNWKSLISVKRVYRGFKKLLVKD